MTNRAKILYQNQIYQPIIMNQMIKFRSLFLLLPTFLLLYSCSDVKKSAPVVDVPIALAVQQNVQLESEYPGETYGESDIKIVSRVSGIVTKIHFKEGTRVKKGQLLYSIDPLEYKNRADEAAGKLASAQSNLAKATSDYQMIEPLAKINAVSQRELVAAKSQFEAATASVKAAEASLANARIELGYCSVTSPIDGLIGISQVQEGDYVKQGGFSMLNEVSDLGSMKVRFTISEKEYMRLYRDLKAENSALKSASRDVALILSDGSKYSEVGKFNLVNRQIDPSTGALTMEAGFANPDSLLRPGLYVKVRFISEARNGAILVPQRAVTETQGIFQLFTVNDSNKVELKMVKVGPVYKDAYVIESGVSVNDKILLGGTKLMRPGMVVKPNDSKWVAGSAKN